MPAICSKELRQLAAGGRIIVHELLLNDDRTGPFPVAAFNVTMLAAMLDSSIRAAKLRRS
jgi:hypothetical protein